MQHQCNQQIIHVQPWRQEPGGSIEQFADRSLHMAGVD